MPNRFFKESICTSEQINDLGMFAEITFYRLIVNVDDFGRLDGRIPILKSKLYPLKDIRGKQIEEALAELSSKELVELYEVDGRPFVRLTGWLRHNTPRAKASKYPAPGDDCVHLQADDNKCMQGKANAPVSRIRNSISDIRTSESEDKKDTHYNAAWRTSARARSKTAQNLIDGWPAIQGKTDGGLDANAVICWFLAEGMTPEQIDAVLQSCPHPEYLHNHLFTEAVNLGIVTEDSHLRPERYDAL